MEQTSTLERKTFKNPQQAFEEAIKEGRLTEHRRDENYAGYYMYMGTHCGKDLFKHHLTREYLQ